MTRKVLIRVFTDYLSCSTYKHPIIIKLSGSHVNRRNTEDLVTSIRVVSIIIIHGLEKKKKKKKKIFYYLSHINVGTICIDVRIIDEKFSYGDFCFESDCRTRVSILYNVDCFTVVTNEAKAEYLDDREKKKKKERWFFGLDLPRQGINCRKQSR